MSFETDQMMIMPSDDGEMTVSNRETLLLNRVEWIIADGVDPKMMKGNSWTKLKKKGDDENTRRGRDYCWFLINFEFYDHWSQISKPRGSPTDIINLYRGRWRFHCLRVVTFDVWISFSFSPLFLVIIGRQGELKLSMHTTGALSWLTSSISVFNISLKEQIELSSPVLSNGRRKENYQSPSPSSEALLPKESLSDDIRELASGSSFNDFKRAARSSLSLKSISALERG